jgi:hypothetical protein
VNRGGGDLARSSNGFAVAGAGVAGSHRVRRRRRLGEVVRWLAVAGVGVAGVASSSGPFNGGGVCWSRPRNGGAATWRSGPSDGGGVCWSRPRNGGADEGGRAMAMTAARDRWRGFLLRA